MIILLFSSVIQLFSCSGPLVLNHNPEGHLKTKTEQDHKVYHV